MCLSTFKKISIILFVYSLQGVSNKYVDTLLWLNNWWAVNYDRI